MRLRYSVNVKWRERYSMCMYVRVYVIRCAINPVTKSAGARACISENARKNQITFLKEESSESVLPFRKTQRK